MEALLWRGYVYGGVAAAWFFSCSCTMTRRPFRLCITVGTSYDTQEGPSQVQVSNYCGRFLIVCFNETEQLKEKDATENKSMHRRLSQPGKKGF